MSTVKSPPPPPSPPTPDMQALQIVIALWQQGFFDFFSDELSTAYVRIGPQLGPLGTCRLRDGRFHAWLAAYFYTTVNRLLSTQEIARVAYVLEGMALHHPRKTGLDPRALQEVEREPLLQLLLESVRESGDFRGTMTALRARLETMAKQRGLKAYFARELLAPHILGSKLRKSIELLRYYGIEVEFLPRTAEKRELTLIQVAAQFDNDFDLYQDQEDTGGAPVSRRIPASDSDAAGVTASSAASCANPLSDSDLRIGDADDAQSKPGSRETLIAQINQSQGDSLCP